MSIAEFQFSRIIEASRADRPPPPDVIDWLESSLLSARERGGDLCAALGGPCSRGTITAKAEARDKRNSWIVIAWQATPGDSPNARAENLRSAIRRFTGTTWPEWRKAAEPPRRASELQRALFQACRAAEMEDIPMRLSAKTLKRIVGHN